MPVQLLDICSVLSMQQQRLVGVINAKAVPAMPAVTSQCWTVHAASWPPWGQTLWRAYVH